MATHSSTLGWKTPWTEEPGGLQPTGSQRVNTAGRLHFHFLLFMLDSPAREVTNQPHFKEKLCRVAWCNGGRSLQTVRRWGSKQQRVASLLAWKTESRVLRGAPRPRPAEFGIQRTGLGEDRGLQGARPCEGPDSSPLRIWARARNPDYRAVKR